MNINDYGPDYAGNRNRNGDGECGGICRTEKVVPGGPLVILYSVDLESSLSSARLAGGKITKGIFSFPGGIYDNNGYLLQFGQPMS